MADYRTGAYWGYRAFSSSRVMRVVHHMFLPPDPELRLQYWHWDLLGPVPFWYRNCSGFAEDDYQDDFVMFEFPGAPDQYMTRLIIATIRDAPAYLVFTYDGVTEQPERRFDLGFARVEAARGFKIRNAEPGRPCRYQIIPML